MDINILTNKIKSASNILVGVGNRTTQSKVLSMISLIQALQQLDKKVTFLIGEDASNRVKSIIDDYGIKRIDRIQETEYVIQIYYGQNKIKEISSRNNKEEQNLEIVVKADGGELSFNDVRYKTTGEAYDLLLIFDTNSIEELENLLVGREAISKSQKTVLINKTFNGEGTALYQLKKGALYPEEVLNIIKHISKEPYSHSIYTPLKTALIMNSFIYRNRKQDLDELMDQLIKPTEQLELLYKMQNGTIESDMRRKILEGVRSLDNKVVIASLEEIPSTDFTVESLLISNPYTYTADLIFIYTKAHGSIIISEQDKYDLNKLSSLFKGQNSRNIVRFNNNNISNFQSFQSVVKQVLTDSYEIKFN